MSVQMGNKAVIGVKAGGVSAAGTFTTFTVIKDLNDNSEREQADMSSRASDFKVYLLGLRDVSLDFNILFDDNDANVLALEDAHKNNTHVGVEVLNRSGGSGIALDVMVKTWNKGQPLNGVQEVSVNLVPTYVDTYPVEV